jgi:RND family efflux transporter MFP subunit
MSKHLRPGKFLTPPLLLLGSLSLGGCPAPEPPPPAEVSRPAEIFEITTSNLESGLRFPGRVRAVQRAELAFDVPGRIVEFPAEEGQRLAPGDLIARLDPAEFELRLASARAEFEQARTDYERVRKIWEKSQAVARAEVDRKRTAMEVARSRYAAARQDLEDTRLTAPFDGVLARKYLESFQNVQAKEPIASLQDVNDLEIVIHVPERVVRTEPKRAAGFARFEGIEGRDFPVTLKTFSAEADPQTQTYEVVLGLTKPQDLTVLPGMSAEVFPESASAGAGPGDILIPLEAVDAGPDGTPGVWVVDPGTSRVARRPIGVGEVTGDEVVVVSGLQAGERIVTAGLSHLQPGMLVRPL